MDMQQRIAQFENMVQADPDNDMAHFSLGGAYAAVNRFLEAAESYKRCIARNKDMSKAYQLAGDAFIKAGEMDDAAQILTEGFKVAASKGDRLPQKAMGDLLKQIGKPVPDIKVPLGGGKAAPPGSFTCGRTGRQGTKMTRPPFKGPVGEWIAQNISKETFDDWIGQGTKVINELRLDLSRDEDEATYDAHMREFLGIDDELHAKLTGQQPAKG
jgi:Fe-S cluster biosynthesis and repair protein YggX